MFSLISERPPVFTLTCITTGGLATTVEWRRERLILTNGGTNTITKTIVNAQESTYKHQLTVSGRHLGVYSVSVSNSKTPSPVQSQYTVTGTYAVINLRPVYRHLMDCANFTNGTFHIYPARACTAGVM